MRSSIQRYHFLLTHYLRPQWFQVVLMFFLALLGIAQSLYSPQLIKQFIDNAIGHASPLSLGFLALLYILLALAGQGIIVASSYLSSQIAWRATNELRYDLMRHSLSLDMGYHKAHTPGEMVERIDGDAQQFSNFFSQFVVALFTQSIMLIGVLLLLYRISWQVGVVMTLFALAAFLTLLVLRRRTIALAEENRDIATKYAGFLEEYLGGTDEIRANGAVDFVLYRFMLVLRELRMVLLKATRLLHFQFTSFAFLFSCGTLIALGLGAYEWSIRAITLGTIYTILSYANRLSNPVIQLQSHLQDVQQVEACLKRIDQLLHTSSTVKDGPGCIIASGPLACTFEQVCFGYHSDGLVLHDISLHLEPGRVLGVLGRTGSGKTTLARLLLRLYDPQQGVIMLNNQPIQQARLADLRQRLGMVTQDVQLFAASIRDNLTFFDPSITDERLHNALRRVGLATWYQRLPEGLATLLHPQSLSAGEAQLLAFARIFLRDPGLIILDEASSHLDHATETSIETALDVLLADRTAILIAHRLSTLQRADDILIIEDGRIQEYGVRTTLLQNPDSRFSQLVQKGMEAALV